MTWFYNSHSGVAAEESGIAALAYIAAAHAGLGWHEYATQAQMLAAIRANKWPPPTGIVGGAGNLATEGVTNVAGGAIGSLNDLAGRLEQSQTWLRVGEFFVGGLLLYVGAKALFPQYVSTVTSTAKKAVKIGPFA